MYVRTWNKTIQDAEAKKANSISHIELGPGGYNEEKSQSITFRTGALAVACIVFETPRELAEFVKSVQTLAKVFPVEPEPKIEYDFFGNK